MLVRKGFQSRCFDWFIFYLNIFLADKWHLVNMGIKYYFYSSGNTTECTPGFGDTKEYLKRGKQGRVGRHRSYRNSHKYLELQIINWSLRFVSRTCLSLNNVTTGHRLNYIINKYCCHLLP